MNEFFTWSTLATYAGALAATLGVTQLFKDIGFIQRIPTRIFSWVVAVAVLLTANYFILGALTASTVGICAINAVVISLAANGGFDAIKSIINK